MKQIFKSYVKSFLKHWVETFGSLFFVTITIFALLGTSSAPININNKFQEIFTKSGVWNSNLNVQTFSYDLDKIDNIFNNPENKFMVDTFNIHQQLLNYNYNTGLPVTNLNGNKEMNKKSERLIDYLQFCWKQNTGSITYSFREYVDFFIRSQLLIIQQEGNVFLPESSISKSKKIPYQNIINPEWRKVYKNFHNQIYAILNLYSVWYYRQNIQWCANIWLDYNFGFTYWRKNSFFYINQITNSNSNKLVLTTKDSKLPKNSHEIVINELYAKSQNLKIGDLIKLKPNNNENWKIVGFGTNIINLFPVSEFNSFINNIDDYCCVYMSSNDFNNLVEQFYNSKTFLFDNTYKLYFNQRIKAESDFIYNDFSVFFVKEFCNNTKFINFNDLEPMVNKKNIQAQIIIFSTVGIILFFLIILFINFIIKKELNLMSSQIGLFKSFGYGNKNLAIIFVFKTFIFLISGILIGFLISLPLQNFVQSVFSKNINLIIPEYLSSPIWLIIIFLFLPAIFTFISYLYIYKFLRKNSLIMIGNGFSINKKFKTIFSLIKFKSSLKFKFNFLFKLQHMYFKKEFKKLVAMFFIFLVLILLVFIQFDGIKIIKVITDRFTDKYQPDLDHIFTIQTPTMYSTDDKKISFLNINDWNQNYYLYKDQSDIIYQSDNFNLILDNQKKYNNWHDLINDYLSNKFTLDINNLFEISTMNIDHQSINWLDLNKLLNRLKVDFKNNYFIFEKIKKLSSKLEEFSKHNNNKNFVITINNIFAKDKQEEFGLSTNAEYLNNNYTIQNLNFNLIKDDGLDYLKFSGINSNQFLKVLNWEYKDNNFIPVLVSNLFAKNNNKKINDSFKISFNFNNVSENTLNAKIVGIIQNYNSEKNFICTGYDSFKISLGNNEWKNNNLDVYNKIYSNRKIILNKLNFSNINDLKNNLLYNMDYLSLNVSKNKNSNITIFNLLFSGNDLNITSQIAPPFISDSKIDIIYLERLIFSQIIDLINMSFIIFQILDVLIIIIVLFVLMTAAINETKNFILVLKMFGYKNREINQIISFNYIETCLLAFIFAYLLSLAVWKIIINYVYYLSNITLQIPFNFRTPAVVFGIVFIILIISWIICLKLIIKNDIKHLD